MRDVLPEPVPLEDTVSLRPRAIGAAKGLDWFIEGWGLFLRSPLIFGVMGAVFLGGMLLINLVPLIGPLVTMLFWPHMIAGLYQAARHAYYGEVVQFSDFFAGLTDVRPLAGLGAVYLASVVVLFLLIALSLVSAVGLEVLEAVLTGDRSRFNPAEAGSSLAVSMLVIMGLMIPFAMAFIFSPVLIHRFQLALAPAMRLSFQACLKNFGAFLLWGVLWALFMLLLMALMWLPVIGALLVVAFLVVAGPVYVANLCAAFEAIFAVSDERSARLL